MTNEPNDILWQRLCAALFGGHKTTDEGLFAYRVMQEIRRLQPDTAWPRFLRLAIPALGVGVAFLVLVTRTPSASTPQLMDRVLFHHPTADADLLAPISDDLQ